MARARQLVRYARLRSVTLNAQVAGRWLDAHSVIDPRARELLSTAANRLALSARGYHRALKVARTIADLDGDDGVLQSHVAEALQFRVMDRLPATVPGG
jgi:magnesium chelatase family protein